MIAKIVKPPQPPPVTFTIEGITREEMIYIRFAMSGTIVGPTASKIHRVVDAAIRESENNG